MIEPNILTWIKSHKANGAFADVKNEIIPFLKSQFDYEIQRIPHHYLFETVYKLNYFDATEFLNYWVYPNGVRLFQYKIDEYSGYTPIIYKKNT